MLVQDKIAARARTPPLQNFLYYLTPAVEARVEIKDSPFGILPKFSQAPGTHSRESKRLCKSTEPQQCIPCSLFWENGGQQLQILHFEDHPSLIHTDTKGALTLDEGLIAILNVDKTFFIAVAIAYLGFLEDQEVCIRSIRGCS